MSTPAPITSLDRLMLSFRQLIRAESPRATYSGVYEYAVQGVSADGTTADISPTDTTIPLPSALKVPLRGVVTSTLPTGSKCLLTFINQDPTRPILLSWDPVPTKSALDASNECDIGASATTVKIAGGLLGAARMGDLVAGGMFAITSGSLKTFIG